MTPLTDLIAANSAFAALAARIDPEASVRSEIWPTAARMIDHLGNIQAWATEVVRTGAQADRKAFRRPPERDRAEWFDQTSSALVETLEATDPDRECFTIWGAPPVVSFWRRRMTGEAAKHLWDLRTAAEAEPRMPAETSLDARAGILDEFTELLVPIARARGIERLPRDMLLVADDIPRQWLFTRDWEASSRSSEEHSELDADVLRADAGDLVLFIWERASPWEDSDRYRIEGTDTALRSFSRTPVHL